MTYFNKPIDQITEADILALMGAEYEGSTLDVKKDAYQYPKGNSSAKEKKIKSFVEDICSFANVRGGYILCGIADGNPFVDIEGVDTKEESIDDIIPRLTSWLDQIEPPVWNVDIRPLLVKQKTILLIHVPRSLNAPHRQKNNPTFYIRRSNEKKPMTIDEIRRAFLSARSYLDQIAEFREERAEAILNRSPFRLPVRIEEGFTVVIHLIPLGFSENEFAVDVTLFKQSGLNPTFVHKIDRLSRVYNFGQLNFEGIVVPRGQMTEPDREFDGYTQYYRNGIIEYVEVVVASEVGQDKRKTVNEVFIEDRLVPQVCEGLRILNAFNVGFPVVVSMQLLRTAGVFLHSSRSTGALAVDDLPQTPIRDNVLIFPAVAYERYPDSLTGIVENLKPTLNQLANCAGLLQSGLFHPDGTVTKRIMEIFPQC